jgi:hypothetical protein
LLLVCPCRGFPTEYWWVWASVGFVLGTLLLIVVPLFVATMTFIGGEIHRRAVLCSAVLHCAVVLGDMLV